MLPMRMDAMVRRMSGRLVLFVSLWGLLVRDGPVRVSKIICML